jgi:hypothetical protein
VPAGALAAAPATPPAGSLFVEGTPAPEGRGVGEPPLPDDGDPSSEARTFAVTRAMEEIERSQGVRIVELEPGVDEPVPPEDTEERESELAEVEDFEEEVEDEADEPAWDADPYLDEPEEDDDQGPSRSYDWRGRPIP